MDGYINSNSFKDLKLFPPIFCIFLCHLDLEQYTGFRIKKFYSLDLDPQKIVWILSSASKRSIWLIYHLELDKKFSCTPPIIKCKNMEVNNSLKGLFLNRLSGSATRAWTATTDLTSGTARRRCAARPSSPAATGTVSPTAGGATDSRTAATDQMNRYISIGSLILEVDTTLYLSIAKRYK